MKSSMFKLNALSGIISSVVLMGGMLASQSVVAHGYMTNPPERALLCQQGKNKDCGAAQYEPHSVGEVDKGFPAAHGAVDGEIASGSNSNFVAMDQQSANRWHLNEITDRAIKFDWFYTAAHLTTKWEYFITKNGWNPNAPLTRAQFDLTPFCAYDGKHLAPIESGKAGGRGPAKDKHDCTIPNDKSGHHVILGLWTVGDTSKAFHKAVDVNIVAGDAGDTGVVAPVDGWSSVGSIHANSDLNVGDKVTARAFVGGAESAQFSVSITIESPEEGQSQNWAFKLAEQVNATQTLIRAGVRDAEGEINPIKGNNQLFAKAESGVTTFEMQIEYKGDPDAAMHIHSIQPEFVLENGRAKVDFSVMGNRDLEVKATVFDANNKQVGFTKQSVTGGTQTITVDVASKPGDHTLVMIATSADGRLSFQETKGFKLTGDAESVSGDYDAVYPEGIKSYKAGTVVLQPANGKLYECKPFPYSGWCQINSHHYVPGVGSDWSDAWIAK